VSMEGKGRVEVGYGIGGVVEGFEVLRVGG